jgi:hypothetical protein
MIRAKAQILEPKEFRKINGILTFDGHKLVFKSADIYYPITREISAKEIVQTGARQSLFFFNRFFYVRTREGRKFRFYTWKNKAFVREINKVIHATE